MLQVGTQKDSKGLLFVWPFQEDFRGFWRFLTLSYRLQCGDIENMFAMLSMRTVTKGSNKHDFEE